MRTCCRGVNEKAGSQSARRNTPTYAWIAPNIAETAEKIKKNPMTTQRIHDASGVDRQNVFQDKVLSWRRVLAQSLDERLSAASWRSVWVELLSRRLVLQAVPTTVAN